MRWSLVVSLALVVACSGRREVPILPSPGDLVGPGSQVGVDVVPLIGPGAGQAVVRAVNLWGAAIGGGAVSVQVDGVAQSANLDAFGYGTVTAARLGSAPIAASSSAASTGAAHGVRSTWPGFGLYPAVPAVEADAAQVAVVTRGVVVRAGRELWWAGDAMPAHRILASPEPLLGVRAGNLDLDGVIDVVAWTRDTVILMRGRAAGGMSMVGQLAATGFSVAGVTVGDVSTDDNPDIVIAWSGDGGDHLLEIYEGDGLGGFTPAVPRRLVRPPVDVAIGDNTAEGKPQITVVNDNGQWERFQWVLDQRYVGIGPLLELPVIGGSTLASGFDLNGDGGDEIAFEAPWIPGVPREIVIFDLVGTRPEFLVQQPVGGLVDYADLDGDGLTDLVTNTQTGVVSGLAYSPVTFNYISRTLLQTGESGPIGAVDLDGDGVLDLWHAGAAGWRAWYGVNDPEDTEVYWGAPDLAWVGVGHNATELVGMVELDADPLTTELVTLYAAGGNVRAAVARVTPGSPTTAPVLSDITSTEVLPLDAVVCGGTLWALFDDELVRYGLRAGDVGAGVSRVDIVGSRVACIDAANGDAANGDAANGDAANGDAANGIQAAVLGAAGVTLFDRSLTVVSTTADAGADVALVRVDGEVRAEVCEPAGCEVIGWPAIMGGDDLVVVAIGDTATVAVNGVMVTLAVAGTRSLVDVDGDGHLDLVAHGASGRVVVYRSTGDGIGPAEVWHTGVDLGGRVLAADINGDGAAELIRIDSRGALVASPPIAPLPLPDDLPEDTGADGDSDSDPDADTASDPDPDTDTDSDPDTDTDSP